MCLDIFFTVFFFAFMCMSVSDYYSVSTSTGAQVSVFKKVETTLFWKRHENKENALKEKVCQIFGLYRTLSTIAVKIAFTMFYSFAFTYYLLLYLHVFFIPSKSSFIVKWIFVKNLLLTLNFSQLLYIIF